MSLKTQIVTSGLSKYNRRYIPAPGEEIPQDALPEKEPVLIPQLQVVSSGANPFKKDEGYTGANPFKNDGEYTWTDKGKWTDKDSMKPITMPSGPWDNKEPVYPDGPGWPYIPSVPSIPTIPEIPLEPFSPEPIDITDPFLPEPVTIEPYTIPSFPTPSIPVDPLPTKTPAEIAKEREEAMKRLRDILDPKGKEKKEPVAPAPVQPRDEPVNPLPSEEFL